ncbi:MAG: hypothetical protein JXA79_12350 [Deltaproteobacteria bacterium]|nr:hypothetical protein [Deltaproteobacteria bacterium]
MHNCAKDVLAFHDEEVTLKQGERTAMRNRRDANRERLKKNLKENGKPLPEMFIKQGSYAMLTMVQDADKDYDIDDGIYFTKGSLKDKAGNDMAPKDIRQMVCNALKDDRFNKQPQVRKSCVRIFYEEGYHVDMPIYRITEQEEYELAMGDSWTVSRAADVEDWFNDVNQKKSPDENNGRQFRRIVRLLKKFARSRVGWKEKIASGFTITKLAEECYLADKDREDSTLRETMKAMHARLFFSLEVDHPVTPSAKLTKGPDDEGTKFLRGKLSDALNTLNCLDDQKCTHENALAAWDKIFNTDFFSSRCEEAKKSASSNAAIFAGIVSSDKNPPAVDKKGGGTFA